MILHLKNENVLLIGYRFKKYITRVYFFLFCTPGLSSVKHMESCIKNLVSSLIFEQKKKKKFLLFPQLNLRAVKTCFAY